MTARQGDRIILATTHPDAPTRDGDVLEVRGRNGEPPYLVRWADGLLCPGPGAVRRVEADTSAPVIGDGPEIRDEPPVVDELAVARARRHLADEPLESATQDIDALMAEVAHIRFS